MQRDPQQRPQQRQQTGRNRCEDCGTNFNHPDELTRHREANHPQLNNEESRNRERENASVE